MFGLLEHEDCDIKLGLQCLDVVTLEATLV